MSRVFTEEERKARNREYNRNWRKKHRSRINIQQAEYRLRNKEAIKQRKEEWLSDPKNLARYKESKRRYYERNKEKINASSSQYAKNNPDWKAAQCAKRRVRKFRAMPKWANEKYIKLFYKLAKIEEKRTGRKVHVDHIIPLKHPLVCGLHCEDNLQLLFAEDNSKKHNRFHV